MSMMEAIVFEETGKYAFVQRPVPEIKDGHDVKIKILAAAICGSDVHILADPPGVKATKGAIIGHECVAEVVEKGEKVDNVSVGDRVILDNNLTCGICPACRSGHSNMCKNMQSMGSQIDGIYCEYQVVPDRALMTIQDSVDIRKAVLAEPIYCVMSAMKKFTVTPGQTCVVLGSGPLGMMFAGMLKIQGAGKVLMSEPNEKRAAFARENQVDRVINPISEDLESIVLEETEGTGADLVIDAAGALFMDAIKIVKPAGTILLFGLNANARSEIRQCDITMKDITVLGNYIAYNSFADVANALNNNVVDFSNLITHEYALCDFGKGLDAIRRGEAMKVVVYP